MFTFEKWFKSLHGVFMKIYSVLAHDTFSQHSQMNFSIGSISIFLTVGFAKLYQKIAMKLTK